MPQFKLHLEGKSDVRVAIYDPLTSSMTWEDSGEPVVTAEALDPTEEPIVERPVAAVSPTAPGIKTRALRTIKIQMGFACNYSCNYCSQNNQRPESQESIRVSADRVEAFFAEMPNWFDGGERGDGAGVHLEFWGGETLLYWKAVLRLATLLRGRYPQLGLALFTNGSMVTKEMADAASVLRIHFIVSHDGPTFSEDRAKDPFDIPPQAQGLHYLFRRLQPMNLISFNATVSPKNFSVRKIRRYIAEKLGAPEKDVILTYDLATPYDDQGLSYVAEAANRRRLTQELFEDMRGLYPFDINVGMTGRYLQDFYQSLVNRRTGAAVGQKCTMDLPSSLAVDLEGNALTCQNVTANGGHKIGEVKDLDAVRLTTAYHWSNRNECGSCPVVQICKGSCMFLTDKLWEGACNQHFIWGTAHLALALYLQTNRRLVKIEGEAIRSPDVRELLVLESKVTA
jgi:uncharacterized protein